MNKDKIIKDLKERNSKLKKQYELRDIRCCHLEQEIARLEKQMEVLEKYNKMKENKESSDDKL